MSTFLALFLSTAIFKDMDGIINSPDTPGSRNNLQSVIRRRLSCKNSTAYFSCIIRNTNTYSKLPYDEAVIPVKRIDVFQMGSMSTVSYTLWNRLWRISQAIDIYQAVNCSFSDSPKSFL